MNYIEDIQSGQIYKVSKALGPLAELLLGQIKL